jgi:hypothetical protein
MLKLPKQVFIAMEELRGENYATFAEGFLALRNINVTIWQ